MKRIGNGYWHFGNCPFGHVTRVSENQLRVRQIGDCDLKRVPKRAEAAAPGFRWPLPSSQPHAPGAATRVSITRVEHQRNSTANRRRSPM